MEQFKCNIDNDKIIYINRDGTIKNRHCLYTVDQARNPKKNCSNCPLYISLHPKRIKKEDPIKKAINEFHQATRVPKENVKFYIHIREKINEARTNSKLLTKPLQKMIKGQVKLLRKAINHGWIEEKEASLVLRDWADVIDKKNKLSMWQVEKNFIKSKKTNPGLEVLSRALLWDTEEFGKKPHYSEVSKLLSCIAKENKGHSYTVPTLKDKYPLLKIPGVKPTYPLRITASKIELILNTLLATKLYLEGKGESLLPNPPPPNPRGYVRVILEILDALPHQHYSLDYIRSVLKIPKNHQLQSSDLTYEEKKKRGYELLDL